MLIKLIISMVWTLPFVGFSQTNTDEIVFPQLGKSTIKEVVAAMTLDEKVTFIRGIGMPAITVDNTPVVGVISGKVPGAGGATYSIPRLDIPSIIVSDGPAGLRIAPIRKDDSKTYYATAFPIGTALASTWNEELVKKVGEAMGNEVKEYGVDIILGPAVNIHRNPLGGRNFEYYSEDPFVAGKIAAAMIDGIQSNGVGTSIKHFAVNNQESNRNNVDAIISQRALREIYLKAFEIAIKQSNPWTVMSSYNKINGTYTSENYDLLTTILREEWGFKGLVMTDWYAGKNYPAQMKAGNDLLMPGRKPETTRIKEAIQDKTLNEDVLDKNIERILNLIVKLPSFENYKYSDQPDLKAHALVAREAGSEGMVLLKNDDSALPLNKKKIALLGNASYDLFAGGTGSGEVNKAYTISLLEGLTNAGFEISVQLQKIYQSYVEQEKAKRPKRQNILQTIKPFDEMKLASDQIQLAADESDIALITIGRNAGEGADRKLETDYYLSASETELIENTSKVFHKVGKKVVVVLNIDAVVDVTKWRDKVDGIIIAWQPGLEAGNSIADVLSGKVNPSGRLATTFPMNYSYVPSAKSFPGTPAEKPEGSVYDEGIYVGYRYYNTFNVKPAYEFGYGLSYTSFKYSNLKLSSKVFDESLKATVTVTNTGKVAGKEVVQLYLSAPAKTLDKPALELKGFAKTAVLKSGTSQTITFAISANELASFITAQSAWIAEAGEYAVKIGASSADIRMSKTFTLQKELVVEKVNNALVPILSINELNK